MWKPPRFEVFSVEQSLRGGFRPASIVSEGGVTITEQPVKVTDHSLESLSCQLLRMAAL